MENLTIYFDMDGTLFDLYAVPNWEQKLRAEDASPYLEAPTLINLRDLANLLQNLQKYGVQIGVISWLSMNSSREYNKMVRNAKRQALKKIGIDFDEIHFVKYGYPKYKVAKNQENRMLFDDNKEVLKNWKKGHAQNKIAVEVPKNDILEVLEDLLEQLT
jgi:hypothetical protein